jgi:hypothetical protein
MIAPFFTYDGDFDAGLFSLHQYARLWPNTPLQFVIPFSNPEIKNQYTQQLPSCIRFSFSQTRSSLGDGFPSWIESLLSHTQDNWFFWCSSDRYPVAVAPAMSLISITEQLVELDDLDAIRLVRWRDIQGEENDSVLKFAGLEFRRRALGVHGLWHPQFISRRHLLWIAQVARKEKPSSMQEFNASLVAGFSSQKFFGLLSCKPLLKVEEPTSLGKASLNYRYRRILDNFEDVNEDQNSNFWYSFSSPHARKINDFWSQQPSKKQANSTDALELLTTRKFPHLPLVVATFGGCGSKFLVSQLYPGAEKSTLYSSHLHWRVPPLNRRPSQKIIYIYGDPRNTIVSFFQRRDSLTSMHGFTNRIYSEVNEAKIPLHPEWVVKALRNLECDPGPLTLDWDLAKFLENGMDLFRLEEHFDNWLYSSLPYSVIFCRYETLWHNWSTLQDMLKIALDELPPPKPRRSDWQELPSSQRSKINRIYGEFAQRLDSLPDLFQNIDVSTYKNIVI